MKLPRLHLHRDPHWQLRGANAYYECRCGARRVRWHCLTFYSPVAAGWPLLLDRHGRDATDTGWCTP